jgi:hypothetical protein
MGYVEGTSATTWSESEFGGVFVSMRDLNVGRDEVDSVGGAWTGAKTGAGRVKNINLHG